MLLQRLRQYSQDKRRKQLTETDVYEGYVIQKISVFIHNNQIEISITNGTPIAQDKQYKQHKEPTYKEHYQPQTQEQMKVAVRVKNHQTIIEIPKRMLNITNKDMRSCLYLGNKRYNDNH